MRDVLCLPQILKLCNNGSSGMFKHVQSGSFYGDLKVIFLLDADTSKLTKYSFSRSVILFCFRAESVGFQTELLFRDS